MTILGTIMDEQGRKKIDVGSVYTAHCYCDDERKKDEGHYHFKILAKSRNYYNFPIYLGLKLDVEYDQNLEPNQCFWFDWRGIWRFDGLIFVLKRKITKSRLRVET